MSDVEIVTIPKEFYYHEVAYVKELLEKIKYLEANVKTLVEFTPDHRATQDRVIELEKLVRSFMNDERDYMIRNNLGDPEKQHNIQWARNLGIKS